ncbi:hypothetical protein [Streptomyces sp. NPDC000994]
MGRGARARALGSRTGYRLKDAAVEELISAVHAVAIGETVPAPPVATRTYLDGGKDLGIAPVGGEDQQLAAAFSAARRIGGGA